MIKGRNNFWCRQRQSIFTRYLTYEYLVARVRVMRNSRVLWTRRPSVEQESEEEQKKWNSCLVWLKNPFWWDIGTIWSSDVTLIAPEIHIIILFPNFANSVRKCFIRSAIFKANSEITILIIIAGLEILNFLMNPYSWIIV
jgi:hypothetical protein